MSCWPTWCYCSSGSRPAAAVTICPSPLTVTVCQRSGDIVQQWVTEWRVTQARRLLTATELPISEVSRRAGFPDTGHFTRTFSNMHAMSPTRCGRAGTAFQQSDSWCCQEAADALVRRLRVLALASA
jgi:AraC-like DNA-binding protein